MLPPAACSPPPTPPGSRRASPGLRRSRCPAWDTASTGSGRPSSWRWRCHSCARRADRVGIHARATMDEPLPTSHVPEAQTGAQDSAGRLCVGLISGTSADGIDAALVRISGAGAGARLDLVAFRSTPYPPDVRRELLALYAPDAANAIARLCSL